MNSKFFVPFETAKALKEKGYNEECRVWYDIKGRLCSNVNDIINSDMAETHYSAPTYHEVIDWLEGKDIYISVIANFNHHTLAFEYYCHITNHIGDIPTEEHPTRKEALNAVILKALELI